MSTDPMNGLPPPQRRERRARFLRKFDGVRSGWEWAHPWAVGAAVGVATSWWPVDYAVFNSLMHDVLPTAVSVASILAGLQGAVLAIILTLKDSGTARGIRRQGYWPRLVGYIHLGIVSLALFIVFGMAALVLHTLGHGPPYYRAITATLVGLFAWSVLASMRIVLYEIKMLTDPGASG